MPPLPRSTLLVIRVTLVGTAVAVVVGTFAATVGEPRSLPTFGFSTMQTLKAWLATGAVVLVLAQLLTALWIYGRLPGLATAPRWAHRLHRRSGLFAIVVTLPVAWYCVYAYGFDTTTPRTTVHSVLGCAFYGGFVAKMTALRLPHLPGWTLPVLGGLVFAAFIALWWTSAAWWFGTVGLGR